MKKISTFLQYVNEKVQIKVLDVVIDNDGNIYDGNDLPLIKGHIDKDNKKIIGEDGKEYIAGITRSGNLFSFLDQDNDYNILINNNPINIPNRLRGLVVGDFWRTSNNYSSILPITATGWVNIKIDMEILKKIRRYSLKFSNKSGIEGLEERLSVLGRDNILYRIRSTETIQKELSAIMMLHHLNELKNHFDPSSAGFLFESYIAGLIKGSTPNEDNSPIDIEDSEGNLYQIKLLTKGGTTNIVRGIDGEYLDYYIMSYKYPDKIRIFLLDGRNDDYPNYVGNFKVKTGSDNFSWSEFNKINPDYCDFCYDISLLNIQDKIDKIAKGLKEVLDNLYTNLSKFQYNVETILTGVDEKGDLLDPGDFEKLQNNSNKNIDIMRNELNSLVSIIKK